MLIFIEKRLICLSSSYKLQRYIRIYRVVTFELIIKRNEKKIYDIIKRDIAFLRLQIFLLTRCQCQYLLAG